MTDVPVDVVMGVPVGIVTNVPIDVVMDVSVRIVTNVPVDVVIYITVFCVDTGNPLANLLSKSLLLVSDIKYFCI